VGRLIIPPEIIVNRFIFKSSRKTMSIEKINARNQFKGKISNIILGDVVSEVDVDTPAGIVTSVITTRSVRDLELKIGTEVVALVKATEVSLAKLL
jgi:molybdopterin-binding protein